MTSTEALISVLCTYARSNIMLSTLQAFLLITCTLASYSLSLPSANQSEVLDNGRQEGKTRTSGDMNATHLEVTNSTIDSGGQSINGLTDSTTEGQSKNSSDPLAMMPESLAGDSSDNNNNKSNNNNNNNNKSNNQANKAGDPLAMMPESLIGAGDKARLWLNQNNQMVSSCLICDSSDNDNTNNINNNQAKQPDGELCLNL